MAAYRGFADLIRRRRKDLGYTLADVAEKTGWSIPYVSELERGLKQPPPADGLRRLAATLQLSPAEAQREAELSRRSVELDLVGQGAWQRKLAVLLARRYEQGLPEDKAREIIRILEQLGEGDEGNDDGV